MNIFPFDLHVLHRRQNRIGAVLWNFYKGIFIIHINAADHFTRQPGFTGYSAENIAWPHILVFSNIDEQSGHIAITAATSTTAAFTPAIAIAAAMAAMTTTAATAAVPAGAIAAAAVQIRQRADSSLPSRLRAERVPRRQHYIHR